MPLQRVLEPEVMDTPEEACDYDAMDHSHVNRVFVTDMLAAGDIGEDVLDLGTGTAQIPIELCKQHEDCRIMAVDLAIEMLEVARCNIDIAGVLERVQLDHIDAKQLGYEDGFFHTVMSNSIVHHIPEPSTVLAEAVRVVADGGMLFFRDLMRPESDEAVKHLVETYARDENDHQRKMFDDSLRAALSLDEIRELVTALGFEAETVQATSDRHWTWSARKG